jgi:hypothetical protein
MEVEAADVGAEHISRLTLGEARWRREIVADRLQEGGP